MIEKIYPFELIFDDKSSKSALQICKTSPQLCDALYLIKSRWIYFYATVIYGKNTQKLQTLNTCRSKAWNWTIWSFTKLLQFQRSPILFVEIPLLLVKFRLCVKSTIPKSALTTGQGPHNNVSDWDPVPLPH